MLLYFGFYISTVVNSFDWTFSTVNLQPKKFFFTVFCFAPVVCECFYLYTAFGCHCREIHHCSSRKNDCVHCLSSCTVWSLGFLSGLSLYWNNIFIENSFCVVLSKPQRVKLNSAKANEAPLEPSLLRDHFNGFFETVATIFKHYTTHSGVIYSRLTFLRSFSFHIFSKPTNCPLEIAAFNHGFQIQSNSSLWKY